MAVLQCHQPDHDRRDGLRSKWHRPWLERLFWYLGRLPRCTTEAKVPSRQRVRLRNDQRKGNCKDLAAVHANTDWPRSTENINKNGLPWKRGRRKRRRGLRKPKKRRRRRQRSKPVQRDLHPTSRGRDKRWFPHVTVVGTEGYYFSSKHP